MRRSSRAWALLASLTVVAFAACDGEGSGVVPMGMPVQLSITPTLDGPDQVPPALDPRSLRARVTDVTEATEFHTETREVTPGSVFEGALEFSVPAGLTEVALFLELAAQDGTPVWASGPDTVLLPEEGNPGTVSPVLQWVGPGAGAARLELSPDIVALDAGDDTTLVVTAFDQAGNPVAGTTAAVDWVSLSTALGDFVDQSGRWQSNGTRGEVQVVATLSPQRLADTTRIIVQAAPSALLILGGDQQTAPAGSTLSEPVAVQVIATDEEPLAGRTVLFQPQNGGTVGQPTVVADAEGVARTSWTLGTEVGTQTLLVSIDGRPEIFVEVSAEATPVDFQAPTNVSSTPESGGAPPGGISVSWSSADPNVGLFRVQRSLDGGLSWSPVTGDLPGSARSVVDAGPTGTWTRDQEVLHRVQGCDAQGAPCSGWTVSAEAAYTLPRAPGALTAEVVETLPTGTVLAVRWSDTNEHETAYDVCDTDAPGGSCTVQELPPESESVRFTTSVAGDSALITVTARNPGGEAEASVWVQLLTLEDFSIVAISGDGQTGTVSSGLADPLVIEVRDPSDAPVEGVDVTFTPQNGGTATPASATTDAQGRASTTWTLGSAVGPQALIAELTAASSVFVEFTADGVPATIAVPTAVAASADRVEGTFSGFRVSWASSDANVERFRVERRLNGEESWTTVADDLASDVREFVDAGSFDPDREVTYRVQGCDAGATVCSGFGVAAEPAYTPPSAPTDLAAEVTGRDELGVNVALTWTDENLFETGYEVCDSQTPGGACEVKPVAKDGESLTFSTPLAESVLVTVTAVNPTGRASASIQVQLVTLADYSIAVVSGDGQSGIVGSDLPNPVVVEVRDPFGAVADGVDVSFTAQDGGSATPVSATTGAQGRASTTWTLGPTVGSQSLRAEISEASSVHTVVSATAAPAPIDAPTGVVASPSYAEGTFDGFSVAWQSSDANAERFRVERRLDGETDWTPVAENIPAGDRTFFDGSSFQTDREVTYRVQACDAAASNCSGFGVAAPVYTLPAAPGQVSGEVVGYGQNGFLIKVSWFDSNDFNTGYEVCDSEQPGGECLSENSVGPEVQEFTLETAASGEFVYVSVAAVNPTGRASAQTSVELGLPPGTGAVEGRVVEALSEGAIAGASVQLVPLESGQPVETTTDQQGNYRTPPVSPGFYSLVVQRSGYVQVDYFDIDVVADEYTAAERVPMAPTSGLNGTISGVARNAQNLEPLPGAQVALYPGMNARHGEPVASGLTNPSGEFVLSGVAAGTYTLQAEVLGFSTGFRTVVSVGGTEAGGQDIILSPSPLNSGEVRVVLTWGETPADLDAHLTGPLSEGGRFHVYWLEKGSREFSPFAALDVDDTDSFGPETITIAQQIPGTYRFSVHDYTNSELLSSFALASSGAVVEVYQGDELQGRFFVPQGEGTLWTVFELDNGQVTPVNELSYQTDGSAVQSPRPPGAAAPAAKGGPVGIR